MRVHVRICLFPRFLSSSPFTRSGAGSPQASGQAAHSHSQSGSSMAPTDHILSKEMQAKADQGHRSKQSASPIQPWRQVSHRPLPVALSGKCLDPVGRMWWVLQSPWITSARGLAGADDVEMTCICPETAEPLVCPKGLKLGQTAAVPTLAVKASNHTIRSPNNTWDSLGGSPTPLQATTITNSTQSETCE